MKFLYLGERPHLVQELQSAFGRNSASVAHTDTPETAFFQILRGGIHAIFLDVAHLKTPASEVISILDTLDNEVEIILISEREILETFPKTTLRSCFGFITSEVSSNTNGMILNQMTEKISIKARLETLKNTSIADGLTQLYNHAYIQRQLDEEVRLLSESGEPLSLIMLDIDHFKHYNDRNGHPAGDQVLRKTAELLEGAIRKFDFAARYGGEEFALVLPCCGLLPALRVAERVRQSINRHEYPHRKAQPLGRVSASLGVATLDHELIKDKRSLLELADQALYKAKENGRDRVWYFREGHFAHYRGIPQAGNVLLQTGELDLG